MDQAKVVDVAWVVIILLFLFNYILFSVNCKAFVLLYILRLIYDFLYTCTIYLYIYMIHLIGIYIYKCMYMLL